LSSNEKFGKDKNKKKLDKKGIIITICIVVGIIGASFIVWFLPQGNNQNSIGGNNMMIFSNPNDTLISVNNQYMLLKSELNNQLKDFPISNKSNIIQIKNSINATIKQNNDLMQTLLHGNPHGSMVSSYVKSMNNLKNFSFFLDDIKNLISFTPSSSFTKDLTLLKKKWSIS
jgi:hypothetical protein